MIYSPVSSHRCTRTVVKVGLFYFTMEIIKFRDDLIGSVINRSPLEVEVDFGGRTTYCVTVNGEIYSTRYLSCEGRKQLLKPCTNRKGYKMVVVYGKGFKRMVQVHRLVASCFIDNPSNLPQVNHISEVKSDNTVENLEWVSLLDNMRHGTGYARRIATNTNGPRSKPVVQYTIDDMFVKYWPSVSEAKRAGFSSTNICWCCVGKRRKHKNFKWRYATPSEITDHTSKTEEDGEDIIVKLANED